MKNQQARKKIRISGIVVAQIEVAIKTDQATFVIFIVYSLFRKTQPSISFWEECEKIWGRMTFTESLSPKVDDVCNFPVGQSHGGHGSSYGRQRRCIFEWTCIMYDTEAWFWRNMVSFSYISFILNEIMFLILYIAFGCSVEIDSHECQWHSQHCQAAGLWP